MISKKEKKELHDKNIRRTSVSDSYSRKSSRWSNKYFQILFDSSNKPSGQAMGALVDLPAHIQASHKTTQLDLARTRADGRTDCSRKQRKCQAIIESRLLVEQRNCCRVPLARDQAAGMEILLAAGIVRGDKGYDLNDDFRGEIDTLRGVR